LRSKDLEAIYSNQCKCCGGIKEPNNTGDTPLSGDMGAAAKRIAKGIYNGTITAGSIDVGMTKLVATELRKAVIEGFGKDLPALDYATADYNMLVALEKNCYHFAAAKNYQELKSLTLALKDGEGNIRSFNDFKIEALKISGAYNSRYLKTEYDTAIGSAQMAAKWADIEQNKAAAPMLQYDTVGDGRVRPAHRLLNGIIRPVDDAFWQVYYPPNGWRCRCDVRQLLGGTPTPAHTIVTPDDVPEMFKTNLAKDGLLFPKQHPYYKDCPNEILQKAELLRTNKYSKMERTEGMNADVWVSNIADKKDLNENIVLAKRLAAHGQEVHIQPHSFDKKVKNPEIKLGSFDSDFKIDSAKTNIEKFVRNAIDSANTQGANPPVLVIKNERYKKVDVWRALRGQFSETKRKKNISEVWLLLDDDLVKIKRADVVKNLINKLP
jgi:SPP1 gp7 family putative phage head morphogenesis protein